MSNPRAPLFVMRDIMDSQLQTCDGIRIGRVADVRAELRDDGTLVLTHLLIGPQALAGRLSEHLRPLARFLSKRALRLVLNTVSSACSMGATAG